jgi:hypothetical protein
MECWNNEMMKKDLKKNSNETLITKARRHENTKEISHARSPKLARAHGVHREKDDNFRGFHFILQQISLSATSASLREVIFSDHAVF